MSGHPVHCDSVSTHRSTAVTVHGLYEHHIPSSALHLPRTHLLHKFFSPCCFPGNILLQAIRNPYRSPQSHADHIFPPVRFHPQNIRHGLGSDTRDCNLARGDTRYILHITALKIFVFQSFVKLSHNTVPQDLRIFGRFQF